MQGLFENISFYFNFLKLYMRLNPKLLASSHASFCVQEAGNFPKCMSCKLLYSPHAHLRKLSCSARNDPGTYGLRLVLGIKFLSAKERHLRN